MNKLSKDKRNQLILAIVLTLGIITGFYFAVIRSQLSGLRALDSKKEAKQDSLRKIQYTLENSKQIEADLLVVSNKLQLKEEDMASGDLYSYMIESITKFKKAYRIDIPQFVSGGAEAACSLLPKFPYKQCSVTISGTAYYHDIGRFIADFENRFPTSRVLNLELAPASTQSPEDKEKLTFKMDIVSLVRPASTRAIR